jgi:hypothetical protein
MRTRRSFSICSVTIVDTVSSFGRARARWMFENDRPGPAA